MPDNNKDSNVRQQSQSPVQTDEASAKYPQNEGGLCGQSRTAQSDGIFRFIWLR